MAKKRFNSHLYFAEKIVWRDHQRWYIKPEDGTLYSGCYPTKIKPEDLPDWYVFGRYYKRWGYMSTKGIADLLYRPSKYSNHFLKDDCLYVSYNEKISENPDINDWERYVGWDERVWGVEIIDILKKQYPDLSIEDILENKPAKELQLVIRNNGWVFHESADCRSIYLVPRELHDKVHGYSGPSHMGGYSLAKKVKATYGEEFFEFFRKRAGEGAPAKYPTTVLPTPTAA